MKEFKHIWKFLLIGLQLGIKPVLAQTVTQLQPPTVPSTLKVPVQSSPIKPKLKLQPPPPTIQKNPSSKQKTIRVEKIEFKGNTVFSSSELLRVVEPYIGKKLTFEELLEIRSSVTEFYNKSGYVTTFAFLGVPNNRRIGIEKGVLTIQVIEGKLEKIEIFGGSRLENYIHSRLKKATSPILNSNRLRESLQLLQTNINIERISAELGETSELGKAVLSVKVKIRQPIRIGITADNSRSPSVGSFQRGLQVEHTNLFGLSDALKAQYKNTEGSNAYSIGYSIPVNNRNGVINFSYTNISSTIIERPFNDLDIVNNARSYQVGFRQPIIRHSGENTTQELIVGLTGERIESESSLLGDGFQISQGADERGRTRISALRFSQNWISRRENTAFQLLTQFSLGIGALGATINDNEADSDFFSWRGQGVWLQNLGKTTLLLRGDLQLASQPLLPLEQISLGGVSTIRGYRYSTYLSDNGFLLGTELRVPILKKGDSELRLIPFVDFGHSWNNFRENNERRIPPKLGSLLSVGVGLEYRLSDKLNARIEWGIPLIDENTNHSYSTWQENGIHLNFRYQPF